MEVVSVSYVVFVVVWVFPIGVRVVFVVVLGVVVVLSTPLLTLAAVVFIYVTLEAP